jgi:hypothetical protein
MRLWEFRSFVQLCWGSDVVGDTAVVEQTCTFNSDASSAGVSRVPWNSRWRCVFCCVQCLGLNCKRTSKHHQQATGNLETGNRSEPCRKRFDGTSH